jgi:hypothetical protein
LPEAALITPHSIRKGPFRGISPHLFTAYLSDHPDANPFRKLDLRGKLLTWALLVTAYLVVLSQVLPVIFQRTTDQELMVRICISVAVIMPLGFLLGFAFPTGMRLVSAVDEQPTPWFWGINGATGVLASVLGVMFSMAMGINVTMLLAAACYLLLIPVSFRLFGMKRTVPANAVLQSL